MAIKGVTGFAQDTTLNTALSATNLTAYLVNKQNWPDGSDDRFIIQIGSEYLLISLRVGNTLTIAQRGYNETTPAVHAAAATVTVLGYETIRTAYDAAGFLATLSSASSATGLAAFEQTPSSVNFAALMTDESGTGAVQFTLAPSTNAISASATQTQAAGTALTTRFNRVVTVATTGDAVTLPVATGGAFVVVANAHATNAVGVFPALDGYINGGAQNAVFSVAALKTAMFFCMVAGTWNAILSA